MCPSMAKAENGGLGVFNMQNLAAHSKFFDTLVDRVPAKYYVDSGADEKVRRAQGV